MADNSDNPYPVRDSINALWKAMEAGFNWLHSESDKLRYKLKNDTEIKIIRIETQGLKQSLEFTQGEVGVMKEKAEMDLQKMNDALEALRKRISSLELQLQTEIEKLIIQNSNNTLGAKTYDLIKLRRMRVKTVTA